MTIKVRGAREHNLKNIDLDIGSGLTAVTGVSGSGKTSLVFDTIYHEARRRLLNVYSLGSNAQRLSPAKVASITGLGPAVAVGQNLLNRNPNSTLATASGLHPFLRLLYARFGQRTCARCGSAISLADTDEIVHSLLKMASAGPVTTAIPLVRGAPGSHKTLLALLQETFGSEAVYLDGQTLKEVKSGGIDPSVPHDIDIDVSTFDAGVPPADVREMIEAARALGSSAITAESASGKSTFSWAAVCPDCGEWFSPLEPVKFHKGCPYCGAEGCNLCQDTGLHPEAAATRWCDLRLPDLLDLSVAEAKSLFSASELSPASGRLLNEIQKRLEALVKVGLDYLTLNRSSPTLSKGEAQRVRLAIILTSRLEDMLHVLDEPTIGQHPADMTKLLSAMRELPGPVVYVEHDRLAVVDADRVVDIGPGAGIDGGEVVFQGQPAQLWESSSTTGLYFSKRAQVPVPNPRPPVENSLRFLGAVENNLRNIDVQIPLERLTVVTGVSGSGKSTLVEQVIAASLAAKEPIGCDQVEGPWLKAVVVDQKPIGRNPRSNPATYTKLADIIRDFFATASGLSPSHFSFNREEGACPECAGMGAVEVRMRYMPSTWIPCEACQGRRFSEEICETRVDLGPERYAIDEIYDLPVSELRRLLENGIIKKSPSTRSAQRILSALCDIGLGYLALGQPSPSLSGGEAQRVKLAKFLGRLGLSNQLLILDEPTTGLHSHDIAGLLVVLDRLVRSGATILMVEHNLEVIAAADWIIDLGPGAGPAGGEVVYQGPIAGLMEAEESATRQAIAADVGAEKPPRKSHEAKRMSDSITITGAKANNLKDVSLRIPKGALTVVTGVSGSGKSSLVSDVLEIEARRRYLESLSLYERQGISEGPEAEVEEIKGLGVALAVGADRELYAPRSTVGTSSEITHHLAVLMTWLGRCHCANCGASMIRQQPSPSGIRWECVSCGNSLTIEPRLFSPASYGAACTHCSGLGSVIVPNPAKLIRHPDLPLCGGAMYSPGFFPKGYLCKPYNNGYDLVRALADRYGFDPTTTPWNEMSSEAQQAFLFGDPEPMEVFVESRSQSYTTSLQFPGFYGWVRDWDTSGTYSDIQTCPSCHGARLRPEFLTVELTGFNMHQLVTKPAAELMPIMEKLHQQHAQDGVIQDDPAAASLSTVRRRLRFLDRVGLGYLHLSQPSSTLSAGEAQRIRLAGLMGSELASMTILLDEPTRGMHPREMEGLLEALREMSQRGNTVIVVEHEEQFMRGADFLVDMGPGSGTAGGEIAAIGSPAQVQATGTTTALWLSRQRHFDFPTRRRSPSGWLAIREPKANNLQGEDVQIPLGVLVGICGVSGSGKSTLLIDTLGRVLAPQKHTTSIASEVVEPGKHRRIEGAPKKTLIIDQTRAGLVSPASFLNLEGPLRALFSDSQQAAAEGMTEADFRRSCSSCRGRGVVRLDMGFLPPVYSSCESCQGTGYLPEARRVQFRGHTLPELSDLTLDDIHGAYGDITQIGQPIETAKEVGLGYLTLHQPGRTLSGGEAQRLKIARELSKRSTSDALYILDEPTVGQHLEDVRRLVAVLHRLVDEGHGVIVIEHHPHLLASCDWLIELGPGGGPEGGRIIGAGTPEELAQMGTPTGPYISQVQGGLNA